MSALRETAASIARFPVTVWTSNTGFDRITYAVRGTAWQLLKRRGRSFVTTLANGAKIDVRPVTAFTGIFYSRWLERKDTLFIRDHANLARVFVDVGANVGLFSAQLFDVFEKFYLYEPAPSAFAALQGTLSLNPSVGAKASNMAVSDRPCSLPFMDDGDCSTTSRAAGPADAGATLVPADTLDNLLPGDVGPFVLKVDVEGFEEQVFRGAMEHFHAQRPRLVMFERLERTNLDSLLLFFGGMGYAVFYVENDGAVTRNPEKVTCPLVNLFACPETVFSALAFSDGRR